MKNINTILVEAIVVGIILYVLVFVLQNYIKDKVLLIVTSGFIFHVLFEYLGINEWYSIDYCKRLPSQVLELNKIG